MIRLSFKIAVGLLLTGCTVNTTRFNNFNTDHRTSTGVVLKEKEQTTKVDIDEEVKEVAPVRTLVVGNIKIRPECSVYVPLPLPKPVKIDFKELEAATTGREINAIALRNVKALHDQMNNYAAHQQKHYASYKQRCVIK